MTCPTIGCRARAELVRDEWTLRFTDVKRCSVFGESAVVFCNKGCLETARSSAAIAADGVAARSILRVGAPWQEIVRAASDEHAQIIVMGTLGRTGLERVMLGSVAERVVRRAPCPVLTVRPPDSLKGETS